MSRLDSRLLRALDDWLFPERVACLCCDAALDGDDQSGLCPGCAQARFPASPVKSRRCRRPQALTRRLPRFHTPISPVS